MDDELLDRVAHAIFGADRDFEVVEDQERLPDRYFKIAISRYRAMAREAIAVVRQHEAGK